MHPLGDGTKGSESWLGGAFAEDTFNALVTAVSEKMDKVRDEHTTQRAVILLHDIRPYDELNVEAFIEELKAVAAAKGVTIVFDTLSNVAE